MRSARPFAVEELESRITPATLDVRLRLAKGAIDGGTSFNRPYEFATAPKELPAPLTAKKAVTTSFEPLPDETAYVDLDKEPMIDRKSLKVGLSNTYGGNAEATVTVSVHAEEGEPQGKAVGILAEALYDAFAFIEGVQLFAYMQTSPEGTHAEYHRFTDEGLAGGSFGSVRVGRRNTVVRAVTGGYVNFGLELRVLYPTPASGPGGPNFVGSPYTGSLDLKFGIAPEAPVAAIELDPSSPPPVDGSNITKARTIEVESEEGEETEIPLVAAPVDFSARTQSETFYGQPFNRETLEYNFDSFAFRYEVLPRDGGAVISSGVATAQLADIYPPGPLYLAGSSPRGVPLTVRIPARTAAGEYDLRLSTELRSGDAVVASYDVTHTVALNTTAAPTLTFVEYQRHVSELPPVGSTANRLGDLPFTPLDIAFSPDGAAYAISPTGPSSDKTALYRVYRSATGGLLSRRIGTADAFVSTVAFRGDGSLFGVGANRLYRIDPATAAATFVSEGPTRTATEGLAFAPNGDLYLAASNSGGTLSRIAGPDLQSWVSLPGSFGADITALRFVGDRLIGYDRAGALFGIDLTSGTAAAAGKVNALTSVTGVAAGAIPTGAVPDAARELTVGSDADSGTVRLLNPDRSERFALKPFGDFSGGVRTAAADFNGDGVAELIAGTGPGTATRVRVLDGATGTELFAVEPFEASFTGGVYVTAGDLNGDGTPDLIITPDEGGGPRVDVYNGAGFGKVASFFGIDDANFRGGARSGTGDINGDGRTDLLVVAGFGGGPRVAGFDGKSIGGTPVKVFADFFAFEQGLRNGVFVAAGDLDGDGFAELIAGGGPGGGPRITAFSGRRLLRDEYEVKANFFGGDESGRGGVRVAVKNLDNDSRADVVVGAGTGAGSRVTAYYGKDIAAAGTPAAAFDFEAFPGSSAGVFVG